jgi:iron(III) transport system ATP-binding protein
LKSSKDSPAAELTDVSVVYGEVTAVSDASFALRPGEVHALLGTSGAGKTTLLRAIAGFERISGGEVRVGARPVDGPTWVPPEQRRVGVVFQDYALFPHLSVAKNIAFGIPGRDPNSTRVVELLKLVGLPEFGPRAPRELSGGEQQRVALARALAQDPAVLLLDEPFAHLDPSRREELRDATLRIVRAAGVAALLVTHDAADAMVAADKIHVMSEGRIAQSGTPRDVYRQPTSRTTALALGPANFLPGSPQSDGSVHSALGPVRSDSAAKGELMVRPEWIQIGKGGETAVIESVRFLGSYDEVVLRVGEVTVTAAAPEGLSVGTETTARTIAGWVLGA